MSWWLRPTRVAALAGAVALPLVAGYYLPGAVEGTLSPAASTRSLDSLAPVEGGRRENLVDPLSLSWKPGEATVLTARDGQTLRVESDKGTRVLEVGAAESQDVPAAALAAYRLAARTINAEEPGCDLSWPLLAAIGRVESDHGRYGGSVVGQDGVARPSIIGIALDGVGPVAAISDTDGGELDGDLVWDRAVGPMQFIPSTWDFAGRDGDEDGQKNPQDLDDAALAAAAYLCAGSESLSDRAAMASAIYRYNPSEEYVALVLAFERGYRTGVLVVPSPSAPADEPLSVTPTRVAITTTGGGGQDAPASTPAPWAAPPAAGGGTGTTGGTGGGDGPNDGGASGDGADNGPSGDGAGGNQSGGDGGGDGGADGGGPADPPPGSDSSGGQDPEPSDPSVPKGDLGGGGGGGGGGPAPQEPAVLTWVGPLTLCGEQQWCAGDTALDLGTAEELAATAAFDHDGDGVAETNADEIAGLVEQGEDVVLTVTNDTDPLVVLTINDFEYRDEEGAVVPGEPGAPLVPSPLPSQSEATPAADPTPTP